MANDRCSVWTGMKIEPGTMGDYAQLEEFHYRGGRPGAVKRVFVARYHGPGLGGRDAREGMMAAVLVESLPPLGCALRRIALPGVFETGDRQADAALLNRDMRTISRVVVHPMFRGVGLAVALVRHLLAHTETRYVEALAAMGRVNPFFEKAGMRKYERPMLPDAVRVLAALESAGLRPPDLADTQAVKRTPFLEAELRRFSRNERECPGVIVETWRRLMSQPVYYLWSAKEAQSLEDTTPHDNPHA